MAGGEDGERPLLELKVEAAAGDAPVFRATLQQNEDQLDELSWVLDSFIKTSRSCIDYASSTLNERVH